MGLHCIVYDRSSQMLEDTNIRAQPENVFFMRWLEIRLGRDQGETVALTFAWPPAYHGKRALRK